MKKTILLKTAVTVIAVVAAFLFLYIATDSGSLPLNEHLLWLFGLVYYLLILFFFIRKQWTVFLGFGKTEKLVITGVTLAVSFAVICTPFLHYNTLLQSNDKVLGLLSSDEIIVKPLNTKSQISTGTNVLIYQVEENGNSIKLDTVPRADGWTLTNDQLLSQSSPNALHIPLSQHWLVSISFYKLSNAGRVAVTFLGKTRRYNLYSPSAATLTINLNNFYAPSYARKPLMLRLFYYGVMLLVWLVPIFGLVVLLAGKRSVILQKIR